MRGGVGRGKRRLTTLAGGGVEPDDAETRERVREGTDFTSAEELRELVGDSPDQTAQRDSAERLAESVEQEVRWLELTGNAPGGLPWDRQPAWRVRLWEHLIDERLRVAAIERAMTAW